MDKRTVQTHQRMEIPIKPNHALPYPSKTVPEELKQQTKVRRRIEDILEAQEFDALWKEG